jgi:hypothetical protein
MELFVKLPPRCFENMDRSLPFPGHCDLEPENFAMTLEIGGDAWYSTGLYLIPGKVATVTTARELSNCWVQAGSHLPTAFSRSGPWKRLPAVTVRVPLEQGDTEICSPFGGILYVVCEGTDHATVDISFYDVGRHPMYSRGNPAVWEETRELDAPWAEVETHFAIFSLPTNFLNRLPALDRAVADIDNLISAVLAFMSDDRILPYRIVLDPEMSPATRRQFYPLALSLENARAIFPPRTPSEPLIQLLHHVALRSFLPGTLPTNAREALAALAAYSVATNGWPEEEPKIRDLVRSPSPLYVQFLRIYIESDKKLFPMALEITRPRVSETGGKGQITYGFFVKKLTQVCGSRLTQALLDEAVTATRADVGYELGVSENLEEYHLNPWETDRRV